MKPLKNSFRISVSIDIYMTTNVPRVLRPPRGIFLSKNSYSESKQGVVIIFLMVTGLTIRGGYDL